MSYTEGGFQQHNDDDSGFNEEQAQAGGHLEENVDVESKGETFEDYVSNDEVSVVENIENDPHSPTFYRDFFNKSIFLLIICQLKN